MAITRRGTIVDVNELLFLSLLAYLSRQEEGVQSTTLRLQTPNTPEVYNTPCPCAKLHQKAIHHMNITQNSLIAAIYTTSLLPGSLHARSHLSKKTRETYCVLGLLLRPVLCTCTNGFTLPAPTLAPILTFSLPSRAITLFFVFNTGNFAFALTLRLKFGIWLTCSSLFKAAPALDGTLISISRRPVLPLVVGR